MKFDNLPEDCGVNGVDDLLAKWGPARVLKLFEKSSSGVRLEVVSPPQFQSRPAGMFRVTKRGELLTEVRLTNYHAAVITNVQLDDGVDTKREFEVVAELMGRPSTFTISSGEFSRMEWPMEQLSPSAITYPTQREYARTAIQSFSMGAEERHIYTHTGWRKVDGLWLFLHSDGAVGGGGAVSDINCSACRFNEQFQLARTTGRRGACLRGESQLGTFVTRTCRDQLSVVGSGGSSGIWERRFCRPFCG